MVKHAEAWYYIKNMKYIKPFKRVLFLYFFLILPAAVFAADITFSANTTLSGSWDSFTTVTALSGSEATSLTVGTSTITVTVPSGGTFTLRASSNITFSNTENVATTCNGTTPSLVLTGPKTSVVITPTNSQCATSSGSSTGSSTSPAPAPAKPTNLTGQYDSSQNAIRLGWTHTGVNTTSFEIWRNSGGTTPIAGPLDVVDKDTREYLDRAINAGTTYLYQVVAVGSSRVVSDSISVSVPASSGGGGGGGGTVSAPAPAPAPISQPSSSVPAQTVSSDLVSLAINSTTYVAGVGEPLFPGNFAYGFARVRTLATEQILAKVIADSLNAALPGVFNRLFHQATAKSKQWWYTYVNAYVYGGYTLEEITRSVQLGGKVVHPSIPASAWRRSSDYATFIITP